MIQLRLLKRLSEPTSFLNKPVMLKSQLVLNTLLFDPKNFSIIYKLFVSDLEKDVYEQGYLEKIILAFAC